MLNLFGRSAAERGKSIAIGLLTGTLILALLQVAAVTAQTTHENQDRQAATDVARRFAVALTTYDYAHVGLQDQEIAALSTPNVQERVRRATADLATARASSLGEIDRSIVVTATSIQAEILIETSQVIGGTFVTVGTRMTGLLSVAVSHEEHWVVNDYSWLVAAGGIQSG